MRTQQSLPDWLCVSCLLEVPWTPLFGAAPLVPAVPAPAPVAAVVLGVVCLLACLLYTSRCV